MNKAGLQTAAKVVLGLVVLSVALSVFAQQVLRQPLGWNIVDGRSMTPALRSGDLAFVLPRVSGLSPEPGVGDIVAFRGRGDVVVLHRIVDEGEEGFVTKGDAFQETDVERGFDPVPADDVDGVVPVIAGEAVRVPALGAIVLAVLSPEARIFVAVAGAALLLYMIFGYAPRRRRRVRRPRTNGWARLYGRHATPLNYLGITLVCAFIIMSALARNINTEQAKFELTEGEQGVLSGEGLNFGFVPVGETSTADVRVESSLFMPMVAAFVYDAEPLAYSENPTVVPAGGAVDLIATVSATADDVGSYRVDVTSVVLPELLPPQAIYWLAHVHPLLAAFAVSLIPALVLAVPLALADRYLREQEGMTSRRSNRPGRWRESLAKARITGSRV